MLNAQAFGREPNACPVSSYFLPENIGFSQISFRLFARESGSAYHVLKAVKKRGPQVTERKEVWLPGLDSN